MGRCRETDGDAWVQGNLCEVETSEREEEEEEERGKKRIWQQKTLINIT